MATTRICKPSVPAATYDLVTLESVKLVLNQQTDTSDDEFLRQAITWASDSVAQFCNRVFPAETVTETIIFDRDRYPSEVSGGQSLLQLTRFPIISVATLTEDGNALVEDTDFLTDPDIGQLIRLNSFFTSVWSWSTRIIAATYTAGYAVIPGDVQDVTTRLVTDAFWARGRDRTIVSQNEGTIGAVRYWIPKTDSGNFPPEIADLLDNYRTPVVR